MQPDLYKDSIVPELAVILPACLICEGQAILIACDVCQDCEIQRVYDMNCLQNVENLSTLSPQKWLSGRHEACTADITPVLIPEEKQHVIVLCRCLIQHLGTFYM